MYKPTLFFLLCITSICASSNRFYSQYGQDKYIYENIFKDKCSGVFVDIGAHDGVTLSNTYFFEKKGWSGICVEPNPDVFRLLKANRECTCIKGCIFDKYETVPFLKVSGYAEMLSGIIENYDPKHIMRIQSEIALYGGDSEIINVPCYNLTDLLLSHGITHIDYLSIDTEGGELGILQSIDFSKVSIDIIGVENNYNAPFEQFLSPFGYKKIKVIGTDEIYQKISSHWKTAPYKVDIKEHKLACLQWMAQHGLWDQHTRVALGMYCSDTDLIPKHPDAGKVFESTDMPYQVMHNGLKVEKDGYCAAWMTNLIYGLKGHHEPQEEKAFYEVLKHLPADSTMIELGSYWGYYSLWFANEIENPTNYLIEPDQMRLDLGIRNFALNNMSAHFYRGYVGTCGVDAGNFHGAKEIHIDEFLAEHNIERVHILHSDIQGSEYAMLQTAVKALDTKAIDFCFISTHSEKVHRDCIDFLISYDYEIIVEHSLTESYSADGLIVAKKPSLLNPQTIQVSKAPCIKK